jgi:hypothetical protein
MLAGRDHRERVPVGHVVRVGAFAGGGCNAAENEARTAKLSDAGPPETMCPAGTPPLRQPKASSPVMAFPRMRVCTSSVPS